MKDPERLLQGGATESELRLLRAANEEEPSEMAREQLWMVLGLGASSLLPPASGVVPVAKGTAGAVAKTVAGSVGAKWVVAAVAAVTLAGGAVSLSAQQGPHTPAVAEAPKPWEPRVSTAVTASEAEPGLAARAASPLDVASPSPRTLPAAESARPEASPLASNSIADEIAKLDEIRRLLDEGKSGKASALLDAYARKYPGGALGQEARFLRVEALASSGNLARARELGERFLRENPGSPHAGRIRSLLRNAP